MIEFESKKVNDYLHLIDIKQFGAERITCVFIGEFDNSLIIFDCGTSLDVKKILRYMKRNNLPLKLVKYIIPSHYHFDHMGGVWMLNDKLSVENPNVKILSNLLTEQKYNDFKNELHYKSSQKTFGGLVGELRPVKRSAFEVVKPMEKIETLDKMHVIDEFLLKGERIKLSILKTPGHSPDHVIPFLIKDGIVDFVYFGDALGLLNNSTMLVTLPSCSAPDFNFNDYMQSVKELKKISFINAGFSHCGFISGIKNSQLLVEEHEFCIEEFKHLIIKYYTECPETKYIFNKVFPWIESKIDKREKSDYENTALVKLTLGLIYGMMMDLGFRT